MVARLVEVSGVAEVLSEARQVPALLLEEVLVALAPVVQTAAPQDLVCSHLARGQGPVAVGGLREV